MKWCDVLQLESDLRQLSTPGAIYILLYIVIYIILYVIP